MESSVVMCWDCAVEWAVEAEEAEGAAGCVGCYGEAGDGVA